MIRMYEYEPRIDDDGNTIDAYRDFQNYLFSHPYGFLWDFPNDKVTIYGTAYRISSLRRIPDVNQVTCLCMCEGGGNGSGGNGITKITTDVSLHGEGNEADPLGVQLSKKAGNRLQILDDGCYVGGEPLPYQAPTVVLSSTLAAGNYLKGESFANVKLTVTVTKGSDDILDVRLYDGAKVIHVFENVLTGSYTYTYDMKTAIDSDASLKASVSDGKDIFSNVITYKFLLPIFLGVADAMEVSPTEIFAGTSLKVTGSSFDHVYGSFSKQHIWMCCPESRVIKSITDENGFSVTTAFKKTAVKLTIAGAENNYSLYVFDTKTTGNNYKVTFNF